MSASTFFNGHRRRLQSRHWRQGETWLLLVAVILAVFASYGLSAAGALMQQSLLRVSAELMGADRILSATRQAKPEWLEQAQQELVLSEQWGFNSMVFAGADDDAPMQLVSVKAVDDQYPVKGELKLAEALGEAPLPQPNQVYLDPRLKELLQVKQGQTIELGVAEFEVAGWLAQEPDAGFGFFGDLPSLIMRLDDVGKTQVVQPGSRIWYRYLLAGEEEALKQYDEWLKPQLDPIYRYRGVNEQGSALGRALERNDRVLRLAGLLTMLLSLAAMAVIANRYAERQQREVALLKALGLTSKALRVRYAVLILTLLAIASAIGLLLAHAALWGMIQLLLTEMPFLRHDWVPESILLSLLSGVGGCLFFIWRPFRALLATSAASLIQGGQVQNVGASWPWRLALFAFLCLLLFGFARSSYLAAILLASGVGVVVLVTIVSQGLLKLLSRVSQNRALAFRLAVTNLSRRLSQNRLLLSGFTLASLMIMSIYFLRNDLIQGWKEQLPEGAANHFAMNIQPYQKEPFLSWLQQQQLPVSHVYPVIRGRLLKVNEQLAIDRVEERDNDSRRYISRELNLTYRAQMPEGNELVAGEFHNGRAGEVSVESGMAERLGLELGDEVTFDVAGQEVAAKVTSIREVDWDSLRPNFFMILSESALKQFSASYLASFHLPADKPELSIQLARQFPTVAMINVDAIIKRLERVIRHSSVALTVILVLVTSAALLLLTAQVRAGLDARQHELITMQTLGASRRLLVRITLFEFALLGLVAGLIGVLISEIMLAALFHWVFEVTPEPHLVLWLLGPGFAASLISLFGWQGCRHLLREGALVRLRAESSGG